MEHQFSILAIEDKLFVKKLNTIFKKYLNYFLHCVDNEIEGLEALKAINIDVIIVNYRIGSKSNYDFLKFVKELRPNLSVILTCDDSNSVSASLKNYVDGYISKPFLENEIIDLVGFLSKKNHFESHSNQKPNRFYTRASIKRLSKREFEIAKRLIIGERNNDISVALNVKASTVSTYKQRIFDKLEVNNIVSLSKIFNDAGIITA